MSVRKREWTTSKGEAKTAWVVDYVDGAGKRRLKSFSKKRDAENFAAKTHVDVGQGTHVADGATITIKVAGENWIKAGEKEGLERTTLDQRHQHLNLHIVPYIGAVKLNKLTVPSIRAWQDELRAADRSDGMVKRATVSLGSLIANAVEDGVATTNPVRNMSAKKATARAARQKKRLEYGVDIPTMAEIAAIVQAAEGRYRPMIVTAIFSGLRASELRGLRWADIDLAKGELRVTQRADRYRDIGAPKSGSGHRTVPMTPLLVNTLKEWKLACPKGDLGLAFPNTEGGVEFHQNASQRGLWPTQVRAGVVVDTGKVDESGAAIVQPKYPGWHALRHWYASWCSNRKVDGGLELSPKAVQTRMGHSSITVTYDVYGHLFPTADEQDAMAEAERRLFSIPS